MKTHLLIICVIGILLLGGCVKQNIPEQKDTELNEPADGAAVEKVTMEECKAQTADYKISSCFTKLAKQENDVKLCSEIADDLSAISCQWTIDDEKKMPAADHAAVCDSLEEKKAYCFSKLALAMNAPDYCKNTDDPAECIRQIAVKKELPAAELVGACKVIPDEYTALGIELKDMNNICVSNVGEAYSSTEVCKQAATQALTCFFHIVEKNNDTMDREELIAFCQHWEDNIDDSELFGLCHKDLGILLKDRAICEMIPQSTDKVITYSWRDQCLEKAIA